MPRMLPVLLLSIGPISFLAGCAGLAEPEPAPRPNILVVLSDDHATSAIGAYGAPFGATPHIDRLAAEGLLFERAFVENAICGPSRAAILTGRAGRANGVQTNRDVFDGSQPTFPQLLQAAGYQTALFGKWHLKSDPTGFDSWAILPGQGQYYSPELRTARGVRSYPGHASDVTTDLTLEWLEHEWDRARPFLVLCQHKAPHRNWLPPIERLDDFANLTLPEPATLFDDWSSRGSAAHLQEMTIANHMWMFYDLAVPPLDASLPLEGPDRYAASLVDRMSEAERGVWDAAYGPRNEAFRRAALEGRELTRWKYQRYIKNYLRTAASVDDSLGSLTEWLDEQGLSENTLVIYLSDQGFFLGEHGWYDKRFMYEPALRFPLVMRWPAGIAAAPGTRSSELVQNIDLAATLAEVAGAERPLELEGPSLVPLLDDGQAPEDWRDAVFYEYLELGEHAVLPHRGIRTARHKLIWFCECDEWELYDLEHDPDELHNRSGDPSLGPLESELRRRLVAHFAGSGRRG